MLPPLPRCSRRAPTSLKLARPYQPSPKWVSGRPAHRPFRGLLSVHSRCGLHTRTVTSRDRHPGASDTSSPPCLPRLLPAGAARRVGLAPTGTAPPLHGAPHIWAFAGHFWCPNFGHSFMSEVGALPQALSPPNGTAAVPKRIEKTGKRMHSRNWSQTVGCERITPPLVSHWSVLTLILRPLPR